VPNIPAISQLFESPAESDSGVLAAAHPAIEPTAGSLRAFGHLSKWAEMADGAYAKNTQRAWRADWRVFMEYCARANVHPLPAAAETVREFLLALHPLEDLPDGAKPPRRAPATLRRYLATITRIHRAAKLEDPCTSEAVKLAMRAIARKAGTRQRQAQPFGWRALKEFFALEPVSLRDFRDRALVALAYDVLGRTSEIAQVDVEHLEREEEGNSTLLIPRSKTDALGKGEHTFVAEQTMEWIQAWLAAAGIKTGAVFRVVQGHDQLGERLKPAAIAATLRRAALKAGLGKAALEISGHSARVGASQDMASVGMDTLAIMQAGRWKDSRMPARYSARLNARRGGMAKLAVRQGRERIPPTE
jgi:integrase